MRIPRRAGDSTATNPDRTSYPSGLLTYDSKGRLGSGPCHRVRWLAVCFSPHLSHRPHRPVPQVAALLAAPLAEVATGRHGLVVGHVPARRTLLAVEEETDDRRSSDAGGEPYRRDLADRALRVCKLGHSSIHQLASSLR